VPRPAAKAESTALLERKSAGAWNFSNMSSASFSRAAGVLKDASAKSSGWSVGAVQRQLLYACSISDWGGKEDACGVRCKDGRRKVRSNPRPPEGAWTPLGRCRHAPPQRPSL